MKTRVISIGVLSALMSLGLSPVSCRTNPSSTNLITRDSASDNRQITRALALLEFSADADEQAKAAEALVQLVRKTKSDPLLTIRAIPFAADWSIFPWREISSFDELSKVKRLLVTVNRGHASIGPAVEVEAHSLKTTIILRDGVTRGFYVP